jgi:C4-dicarboxylate-specific signal transduction histidine kinase
VHVRVTDSGHLTDPKVIESMLNPFFTTKQVGEGTVWGSPFLERSWKVWVAR